MTENKVSIYLASFLLMLLAFSAFMMYSVVRTNIIVTEVKSLADKLEECTTPGENEMPNVNGTGNKCYDEGNKRTSVAIKSIVDQGVLGVIFVRSCADEGNVTEETLTSCVRQKLERELKPK